VGCGTGENALYLASRGHVVWGVDSAAAAIEKARRKAEERGLGVTFRVTDTLNLTGIERTFNTVIDIGLFHTLSDPERMCFVRNLSGVLKPGGRYCMLAFSDREPGGYGPRRITQQEIRDTFTDGWQIEEIREAVFESRTRKEGSQAWLASILRR
jgi:2-polyprenyl-3-methyl-5-hydroxy-6-metoxy-1,4-benzoquinol methylase